MIDPWHVLTAGHNIHSGKGGRFSGEVIVYPGRSGYDMPYGLSYATYLTVDARWISKGYKRYDWGIITLDRRLGMFTSSFGMAYDWRPSFYRDWLDTAGYPGDKPYGTLWLSHAEGSWVSYSWHAHECDIIGGQSGSPVWKYIDGVPYALSIQTYHGLRYVNYAARLNEARFDAIVNFLEHDSAQPPPPDLPDFVDDDIIHGVQGSHSGFSPTTIRPFQTFNVWCRVRNVGVVRNNLPIRVRFYISDDVIIDDSDDMIAESLYYYIDPFDFLDVNLIFTFPLLASRISGKIYDVYVGWIIDSLNDALEYNEDDNNICFEAYKLLLLT
jgi:hypothetical protein